MENLANHAVAGADFSRPIDAVFVNAPLRDYSLRPRSNDFTLPVLGMAYIATYAASQGFNVGVIDAEALGLGVDETAKVINDLAPRWAGFNLLAPTYEISARIAAGVGDHIRLMAGGHQTKAMPMRSWPARDIIRRRRPPPGTAAATSPGICPETGTENANGRTCSTPPAGPGHHGLTSRTGHRFPDGHPANHQPASHREPGQAAETVSGGEPITATSLNTGIPALVPEAITQICAVDRG